MMKGASCVAVLAVTLTLTGCGGPPSRTVRLGGQTIDPDTLTAAEVARETSVTTRGEDTIYRAPTLSSYREVEIGRGGPTLGANMGMVHVGRQGFLFGVGRGRQPVASYVAFQSNLVEGTGRYVAVTLVDGTSLPIRTTRSNQARCEPDCLLVFETVVVEVPDAVLRATPGEGLLLDYRLDNGTVTRATVPAAYVRGYLQAVAAAR
jgi:hypothetical protein